jgi:hypothetical protein
MKIIRTPRRYAPSLLTALLLLFSTFAGGTETGKKPYLDITQKLLKKGLTEEGAFVILKKITSLGHRLTASPQAAAAVELMKQEMEDLNLDNVHLEPTRVQRWVRGKEEAVLISRMFGISPLTVCAIGGSVPTLEKGVTARVIEVFSMDELRKLGDQVNGKIVFFNRPMDPTMMETFRAYGRAADQRVNGASEASSFGARAALVRSLTTRFDDVPHTGLMQYAPGIKKIPAACISTMGAEYLSSCLKEDPDLRVNLKLSCASRGSVISYNVIGQITGCEKPEEIILVGGHLDSWDKGTGAHDDGAGCVHALEALRLIKECGLNPKRTIRAVMFMDEEFGGTGGRDYARAPQREHERHLAAIESDRGGFLPLWMGVGGDENTFERLKKWEYLFKPLNMIGIRRGGGGVDIGPLAEHGTVLMGLIPDCQSYFDLHHSDNDVLAAVHPRELELGAVACAVWCYVLAQEGLTP